MLLTPKFKNLMNKHEVIDDFLPKETFKKLQKYCEGKFTIVNAGDKQFSVLPLPEFITQFLEIDGYVRIFSFIRSAYKDFDNEYRIHADNIILGEKVSVASVLYINNSEGVTKNGTAFYEHYLHGKELSECVSNEEFNRLLLEDSNDLSKWKITDYIESKPNRLLKYNANKFHSKLPKSIEIGTRIVLASFYKKID